MVPLCCIYTTQRSRRQYVPVETATFPLFQVKYESSSTDISKYFYKRNNNKKDYYIELNLFFLCWLTCFKMLKCFALVWHYFDSIRQNICDSFFLNRTCFNVVVVVFLYVFFFLFVCLFLFCLHWTPTVKYIYIWWELLTNSQFDWNTVDTP